MGRYLVKLGAGKVDVVSEGFISEPLFYILSLMCSHPAAQYLGAAKGLLLQPIPKDSLPLALHLYCFQTHVLSVQLFYSHVLGTQSVSTFHFKVSRTTQLLSILRPPEYFFTPLNWK